MSDFIVIADDLSFPEGPVFDSDGKLWCVEISRGCITKINYSGANHRVFTNGRPNGLAISAEGNIWVSDQDCGLLLLDSASGELRSIVIEAHGRTLARPNDVIVDASGNVIFTCPGESRENPTGEVWSYKNGEVTNVSSNLQFPNGLILVEEESELIIAETYKHRLWRGQWDSKKGNWIEPHAWVVVGGPIGPDGLALSPEGYVLCAIFGGGNIAVLDMSGQVIGRIKTPGSKPSNLCFSPDGDFLYVTEVESGAILQARWSTVLNRIK